MRTLLCRCLALLTLPLVAWGQNSDLPPATANPVAVPAGTLVLALDNTWQSTSGQFNLKAYG
ncbi:MAG: hypothetical protein EOO62_10790, partial [Hymenobacter sp.]